MNENFQDVDLDTDDDGPYVVIVSSSRSYYNYRHTVNALLVYNLVRNLGK